MKEDDHDREHLRAANTEGAPEDQTAPTRLEERQHDHRTHDDDRTSEGNWLEGLSDAAHFERLKTALFRTRGRTRFDRAAADRILDDLRQVAYRRGVEAARVFPFPDQDYVDAD